MTAITPQYFNDFFSYNSYAAHIHELNAHWWQNLDGSPKELDKGERFMLMVSELAEALEGDRKELKDDKLPQYPMLWVELADTVIRVMDSGAVYGWDMDYKGELQVPLIENPKTVGAQLLNIVDLINGVAYNEITLMGNPDPAIAESKARLVTSIIRACEALAIECACRDFWWVVHDKLVFNASREDHKWEARLAPGGKKF